MKIGEFIVMTSGLSVVIFSILIIATFGTEVAAKRKWNFISFLPNHCRYHANTIFYINLFWHICENESLCEKFKFVNPMMVFIYDWVISLVAYDRQFIKFVSLKTFYRSFDMTIIIVRLNAL